MREKASQEIVMTHWKVPEAVATKSVAARTFAMSHFAGLSRPVTMNIAIVGGTGTVGTEVTRELSARGHAVRVLSRHAPEYPVDLSDRRPGWRVRWPASRSSSTPPRAGATVLVEGTARLLRGRARGGRRASRRGLDRRHRPRRRVATTRPSSTRRPRSRARGVPWTIVRATQFHTLLARRRSPPARGSASLPSVEGAAAAGRPARGRAGAGGHRRGRAVAGDHAVRRPGGGRARVSWRSAGASRPARTPCRCGCPMPRSLRAGGLTNPGAWRGKVTFDAWLAS